MTTTYLNIQYTLENREVITGMVPSTDCREHGRECNSCTKAPVLLISVYISVSKVEFPTCSFPSGWMRWVKKSLYFEVLLYFLPKVGLSKKLPVLVAAKCTGCLRGRKGEGMSFVDLYLLSRQLIV